jgi:capsular polysaccharide biosynthesis protein
VAVPIEARGQIQDFLDVLRRRAWQIAVPAVFVIVIGACLTAIVPRKFLARTQLELRQVGAQGAAKEGQNAKFQILAPARIKKVVEDLKNPVYLALEEPQRRDFLRDVQKDLRVDLQTPGAQSSIFITILYADVDRGWAGTLLRGLRDDWREDVLERDRNKLKEERQKLGDERAKLEKRYLKEEEDLADLKRNAKISATQPIPGTAGVRNEDPEYDRLQRSKTELGQTELSLAKAKSKIELLEKRLREIPEKVSREQVVAGVGHQDEIRKIDTEILDLEQKLRGYGQRHSKYSVIQNDIATKQRRKADLESLITRSEYTELLVANPERLDLLKQIAAAKEEVDTLESSKTFLVGAIGAGETRVAELNDVYKEVRQREEKIGRLRLELSDVDRDYLNRVQQVEMSEGPRGNPFAILEEISVPPKATEPNPMLLMAFSIVAGLGLGVGLAVLLEYSKSCFRSVYDVSRVMVVPVLGNINSIVTRREARIRRTRRLAVASASLLFLGSLGFVTWAWSTESALLSPSLRNAIEDLRSALK